MSVCQNISCCDPSNWFAYSLNGYPVYTNSELTIFVPCPEGFICEGGTGDAGGRTITIPAGTITFRPTNPEQNTPEYIEEEIERQANDRAENEARPQQNPQKFYYLNQSVSVNCQSDQVVANSDVPFFDPPNGITIPAGTVSSDVSLENANALALELANNLLSQVGCKWINDELTVQCDPGMVGGPIVIPAGTYESTVSKADANAQAASAAEIAKEASCMDPSAGTPCVLSQSDNTSFGNVEVTNYGITGFFPWTNVPLGAYRAKYVAGAYTQLAEANNGTGDEQKVWSSNRISFYVNGQTVIVATGIPDITPPIEYTKTGGSTVPMGGSQAAVEALMAGVQTTTAFFHRGFSDIYMKWLYLFQTPGYFSGIVTNTSGTPGITYELVREEKFIEDQPQKVRIAGYNPAEWAAGSCGVCAVTSGEPTWDGQFETTNIFSFTSVGYAESNSYVDMGGKRVLQPNVFYENDGSLGSSTGCGWVILIYCFEGGSDQLVARFEKWTGLTAVGIYERKVDPVDGMGCGTTPDTITLESF